MSRAVGVLERLRRPEYTGPNRCVPCTAVNLAIAGVLAVAVAMVAPWPLAPALGAVVLGVAVAAIALRGYLVPGTPWLTRTVFPDRLLVVFDKGPGATASPGAVEALDAEAVLVRWDALEECPDVDDLCLTPAFREAWRDRVRALREADTSRADLAAILGTDPAGLSFTDFGSAFVAKDGVHRIGQWESRSAFLADVAAGTVLADRVEGWEDYAVRQRGTLLAGLRLFLERCPSCDGPVAVDDEVKRSCCRSIDVVAATCQTCEARLFEAELPEAA